MAWDALAGRFGNQRDEEDRGLGEQARVAGGAGGGGYNATPNPTGGFGGTGGSAGAPVSAGFVNFGTIYDANKEKAKGMASGVYNKAQADVDKAKGSLQGARDKFESQRAAGAGTWRPIQGAHGTRIDNYNPAPEEKKTSGGEGVSQYQYGQAAKGWQSGGSGKSPGKTHEADAQGSLTQSLEAGDDYWSHLQPAASAKPGTSNAGASRYAGIYGPAETVTAETPEEFGRRADYHHSVDRLGAQSGAGQGYAGPDSLQDAIGESEYAALADELAKAEQGTQNLTTAGGIGAALGYGPESNTGLSALDTGLTQVAGQSNFKRLADQTKGLSGQLADAQADSINAAKGTAIEAGAAASDWQNLLDEYDAANAPKDEAKPQPNDSGKGGFMYFDGDGNPTYAQSLLEESGYTATELEEIYGELTPEERAFLNGSDGGIIGDIFNSGNNVASHKQNILAKLARARSRKQGGG